MKILVGVEWREVEWRGGWCSIVGFELLGVVGWRRRGEDFGFVFVSVWVSWLSSLYFLLLGIRNFWLFVYL